MKPTDRSQQSFFDSDFLIENLVPRKSFYRRFREVVGPLITDEMFSPLYCGIGRPPISPALLAKAMLIQYHMNLSDRELERACMFDLEVKFALGLRIDERPFDHSSLGDFRERLLESGKEREIFDSVLKELVRKKLISKKEIQRIDATHVIADIALPNMVAMVKKGTFEILKKMKAHKASRYNKLIEKLSWGDYTSSRINDDGPGRFDMDKRAERLVQFVKEARFVLQETDDLKNDPEFKDPIIVLKTILRENIQDDEDNKPKEMDAKKKPTNRLVSPIDVDARAGCKNAFKKFIGYKTNITQEVKNQFITNIDIMPGNRRDGEPTVDLVKDQKVSLGLKPAKLIGDSAYGDGAWRNDLEKHGTKLVAPFKDKNPRTKAVFPKSMFKLNRKSNLLTCPKGFTAKPHFYESKSHCMNFHFPQSACGKCDLKLQCTKSREGRRTVKIFDWQESIYESEQYNRTSAFEDDMKLRQPIEGKFSEMKRYHGLTRAKFRGIKKVGLQCYFTAAAVNVKRWLYLLQEDKLAGAMV